MSGKYYMLANPYIEGQIGTVYQADNSLKAAGLAYKSISEYFNNSVHNFKFTMLKLKSKSVNPSDNSINLQQYGGDSSNKKFNVDYFSHFVADEIVDANRKVNFSIRRYTGTVNNTQQLIDNVIKVQSKLEEHANKSKTNPDKFKQSFRLSDTESDFQESSKTSYSKSDDSDSNNSSSNSSKSNKSTSSSKIQHGGDQTKHINLELNTSDSYQIDQNKPTPIITQDGGKHHKKKSKSKSKYDDDEDDSSSSSSSDYYVKKSYYYDPISYWYYYPSLYTYDRLYMPTFPFSIPYVVDLSPTIIYGSGIQNSNAMINTTL